MTIEGGPQVRLLDARLEGLDEPALRAWARGETAASGAAHVARSYRYPYAALARHTEPVGIDIERIEPCDTAFARSICTPSEWTSLAAIADPDAYFTAMWSSKEALAKALGDALRYDPRRLESPMLWPGLRSGRWRTSRVSAPPHHTAWVCWPERRTGA